MYAHKAKPGPGGVHYIPYQYASINMVLPYKDPIHVIIYEPEKGKVKTFMYNQVLLFSLVKEALPDLKTSRLFMSIFNVKLYTQELPGH